MTGPTPDTITVNGHRLWRSLMDLAEIGAYDDERTGLRGVNRLALTDADAAGRRQVIAWMEQAGLTVRIDRMGNVYGRNDVEAAARIGVHLRAMVESGAYGELRATVGHLAVHPDLTNIVPARAELTLDLRNPDDARMARAEEDLAAFLRTLEDDTPGLTLTTRRMAKTAYVPFHERVQKVIAQAADDHGLEHVSLLSGAGHDAQEIAALCPTAMVFVRGEYDGISHNPREYSTPEACAHGVDVLATTLLRLATQDPS
ncbi:M20/M25/M40 family metallo-hydrolase [Streptomyces asiaticus]|uniref:M20/M25/M40 family metallo-hydrolase n=1 Tax=Streptomyces asiaticus TaxID=114695 RepID=UPI0038287584